MESNIIQDEENYYFFRALNMEDEEDIKEGKNVDKKGNIIKIRTDRQRWIENEGKCEPKYSEDSPLTLEQICDHIKEDFRRDTNCISLSSDANISLKYGKSYTEKYVMITIPKNEMGIVVVNAKEYILENSNIKTDEIINIAKRAEESAEFIHYGEINAEKITVVPKEVMKVIAKMQK